MKKRYARILAATLSAAMVFTSAPVNFNGIDLGVIEAEAATVYNRAALEADIVAQVTTELRESAQTWDGSAVTYQKVANDAATAVLASMTSKLSSLTITATNPTGTDAGTDSVASIKYQAKINAASDIAAADNSDQTISAIGTINISISKKPIDNSSSEVAIPNDLEYRVGGTTVTGSNGFSVTTSTRADSSTGSATYVMSAEDENKLKTAKVSDGSVKITLFKSYNKNLDYTGADEYTVKAGTTDALTYVSKEVSVEIVAAAATATDTELDGDAIVGSASCTWGGTDLVVLNSASSPAQTFKWTLVEADQAKLSTLDAGTYTVTAQSEKHEDGDVKWSDLDLISLNIYYNSSTSRFEKDITLTVNKKTINSNDLVWPDALADGEKVSVGDDLTKKKLVTTESAKYGKFVLAGYGASATGLNATAKSGSYKCFVKFEPNNNCVTGAVATADAGKVELSTYLYKKNAIAIDADKTVLSESDIAIVLKDSFDQAEFGATPASLKSNMIFKGSAKGTYNISGGMTTATKLNVGKNTLTYKFTLGDDEQNDYVLFNNKSSADVTVDVNVYTPSTKAEAKIGASNQTSVKTGVNPGDVTAVITALNSDGETENPVLGKSSDISTEWLSATNNKVSYKYEWYYTVDGKTTLLRGKTTNTITPDYNTLGTIEYYCVITPTIKTTNAVEKAVLSAVLKDSYTTEPFKLTVANTAITMTINGGNDLYYGDVRKSMNVKLTTDTAKWKMDSAKWYYYDADKVKHELTGSTIDGSKLISTVAVPEGLEVGKYPVVCEVTSTDKDGNKDEHPVYETIEVKLACLDPTKWNAPEIEKTTIKYGTKLSEIKIKGQDGSEKYGTYEWAEPDTILDVGEYITLPATNVVFVPNATTKKNYSNSATVHTTKFKDVENIQTLNLEKITVEKADLTIKPADITVALNGTVDASEIKTETTGLVGADTLANLGVRVSYKVADTVDTAKAGTVADGIETTVTVTKLGVFEKVTKTNAKALLANYNIVVANGSVIVKAKDVAPSVKPTPAPVKQATAAAPKAAKAKATVKVGKKYTLKLKYAAGKKATVKKVTWKSSKKSVATVSSKGKVTAKKAGKATITATITFKDGSKKKVKFTVTVK